MNSWVARNWFAKFVTEVDADSLHGVASSVIGNDNLSTSLDPVSI